MRIVKILSAFFASLFLISILCSCGDRSEDANKNTESLSETISDSSGDLTEPDSSVNGEVPDTEYSKRY